MRLEWTVVSIVCGACFAVATVLILTAMLPIVRADTATSSATTTGNQSLCGQFATSTFFGCYYQGTDFNVFKVQHTDPQINFDWGAGSPDPSLSSDNFSAKWWGLINFDPGNYDFNATADDGVRVNVDSDTIIDQWHDQSATTYTAQKAISGGPHKITVDYYEHQGGASVRFNWSKVSSSPGTSKSYYPNAFPSAWYILPGQTLGFSGSGFAPNESVRIQGPDTDFSTKADQGGNFVAPDVKKIPYSWQESTRTFTVSGSTSDGNVTPKPIPITVGTFYPQITPSDWWVAFNTSITVSGKDFAPSETVRLSIDGKNVSEKAADASGNISFSATTPSSGDSATLTATGLSSGRSSTRTIYLHS